MSDRPITRVSSYENKNSILEGWTWDWKELRNGFCLMLRKRLVEECELTNSDFPEAKSGLKRDQVLEKLTFIRKSLENVKTDHQEVQENRKILLDIIPK